jgi:protein subunit release factor A
MKRVIEIRGAEGGKDAKLFAQDLASAYVSMFERLS